MSPTKRAWPTPVQRAVLRRHLVQVLQSPQFRKHLMTLRQSWRMKRVDLPNGQGSIWTVPKRLYQRFRSRQVVERFGEFWFHALGGTLVAGRLIISTDWETRSLLGAVEKIACDLEAEGPDNNEWRRTYRARDYSRSTMYYAGQSAFHPTAIWDAVTLAADLKNGTSWRVEPSELSTPGLTRTRKFIEVFSWTEDEDVRRAFQQTRPYQRSAISKDMRPRRDFSKGLRLCQGYYAGENTQALLDASGLADERSLRRYVAEMAKVLGIYPITRPRPTFRETPRRRA